LLGLYLPKAWESRFFATSATPLWFCCGFLFLIFAYTLKIYHNEAGSDLLWRLTEAKYFIQGVNPYDEFIKHTHTAKDFGTVPAAYSFVSYYFAGALSLISGDASNAIIIFSFLDILAIFLTVSILTKTLSIPLSRTLIIFPTLLVSVFFWQHLSFLNYTIFATFGLVLAIHGVTTKRNFLVIMGMILVGLKPSFAIPMLILLVISRQWRSLIFIAVPYSLLLCIASWHTHTGPIELLSQLVQTQKIFAEQFLFYRSEGMLLFLRPLVGSRLIVLGLILTLAILFYYRRYLHDPAVALTLTLACGLSFFYNQVHAWIAVFPLLILALHAAIDSLKSKLPLFCLVLFVGLPRLSGLFEDKFIDTYLYIHNVARFGILWYASIILIRDRIRLCPNSKTI
jgi:hypothetical protein